MACCDLLLVRCRRLQRSAKCKYTHYRSTYCLGLRGADVTVWDSDPGSREFGPSREIMGEPLNSRSRILAPNWRKITGVDCSNCKGSWSYITFFCVVFSRNYAPTIYAQIEAMRDHNCQQVLWLYGPDHNVTEVGTMNFFMYWTNEKGGEFDIVYVFLWFCASNGDSVFMKIVRGVRCFRWLGPNVWWEISQI